MRLVNHCIGDDMRQMIERMRTIINTLHHARRGQAFLEFALVIPILVLMLLGVIEVAYFVGRYLDILDLTREAARFASQRDPFELSSPDQNCNTADNFEFYYDTSCVLSPPAGSACANPAWCNGLNPYVTLDLSRDDVVISAYTISGNNVTDSHPKPLLGKRNDANSGYYWALSDHDPDTANNDNWKKDCHGSQVRSEPRFTETTVNDLLVRHSGTTPESYAQPTKGYVAVEVFYCHQQLLNLPVIVDIIPNPVMIHAYTIMPFPAGQPTSTPTNP